jgi:type IV pilus biogenesis protein PilP
MALAICCALGLPGAAQAEGDLKTMDDLDRDITVMTKQIKKFELKEKLEELQNRGPTLAVQQAAPQGPESALRRPADGIEGLPHVLSVEGFKGQFTAIVQYHNGVTGKVRKGDELATGEKVVVVDAGGVVVQRPGKTQRLPFSASVNEGPQPVFDTPRRVVPTDSATQPKFE